ncbi:MULTISPECIES: NIL domain-containing protein [unclassified Leptolyngbya]|uniref:NIL domain-containing protein n=1 Tax=unclassified Leptolyngbya TaxID=2650499 RepID=UPI0016838471|nr:MULTISPECIES: NIL domain-containing protein [unclassified Leptolyngbya]MBD1913116.1 NIL domain-containing protein [Leptolyngbya sp. FACHB-8]MBD2157812.1 NIL domain-containing protein [Leptolyngbya sp. FACHB-16]
MISVESLEPIDPNQLSSDGRHRGHVRLRVRIPAEYRQDPVLSVLITQYGLTVNILAAQLSGQGTDSGWFDLELKGATEQINNGILHLNDLGVEIWQESDNHDGGW